MIVIRGGTILDGTGGEPFAGDVASFSLARFAEDRAFRSTYGGNRA